MYEIGESSYTKETMLADLRTGMTPLEVARRKWTAVLAGSEDFGSSSCACCATYYDVDNPKACFGRCPLGGTEGCCGGVYSMWLRHQNSEHMHENVFYMISCPECEAIARRILDLIEQRLSESFRSAA